VSVRAPAATFVDEPVVLDGPGPRHDEMITSRTPADMTPFCWAIIDAVAARHAA